MNVRAAGLASNQSIAIVDITVSKLASFALDRPTADRDCRGRRRFVALERFDHFLHLLAFLGLFADLRSNAEIVEHQDYAEHRKCDQAEEQPNTHAEGERVDLQNPDQKEEDTDREERERRDRSEPEPD